MRGAKDNKYLLPFFKGWLPSFLKIVRDMQFMWNTAAAQMTTKCCKHFSLCNNIWVNLFCPPRCPEKDGQAAKMASLGTPQIFFRKL